MCEFDQHGRVQEGAAGFVDDLVTAMVNSRIYSQGHPRLRDSVEGLEQRLATHFAGGGEDYTLRIADGYVIYEERPLLGATMSAQRLIAALEQFHGGGVQFRRGATRADVDALIYLLGQNAGGLGDLAEVNRALTSYGGLAVGILPPYDPDAELCLGAGTGTGDGTPGEVAGAREAEQLTLPLQLYQGVVDTLQAITIDVCRGDQFSLDTAKGQLEQVLRRLDRDPKAVMNLARYEHYDAFTFGHSIRVAFLAMTFARSLSSDSLLIQRIGLAGLMHDVGKARVPFEILQSRTRLTDAERAEMERHTVHGGEILLELADTDPWAVTTAFGHHRGPDGTGYPPTPRGSRLSTVTKLIKICDVYEALTAERPYKAGMSPVRAYRIMMSMKHFDTSMLRLFMQTIGLFPIGTRVQLSDGRGGVVEAQTEHLQRPVLTVDTTPDGDLVDAEHRERLDLSAVDESLFVLRGIALSDRERALTSG